MANLPVLFRKFLEEKRYLQNVTPKTAQSYTDAWMAYLKYHGCTCELTEDGLKQWTITMAKAGLKPGAINSYARSFNSFLTWLHRNKHTATHFRVQLAKAARKVLKTYSEEEARRIVAYKPTSRTERRICALLCLLIDTGCRINEALTLTRAKVDWDNYLVTLIGKGRKERRVPISPVCRKELFRWANSHKFDLVFCTRDGGPLRYDNVKRDFLAILKAVGVEKTEGSFHAFRRYFGKQYLKRGGNVLYLQYVMGHSTAEMTRRYVEEDAEDLRLAHRALSPLEGLKKR